MKKYLLSMWRLRLVMEEGIREVYIERETDKSVFDEEDRRSAKRTEDGGFFDSREAALSFAEDYMRKKIEARRLVLAQQEKVLDFILSEKSKS